MKEITLTNGMKTQVDDEDYEKLNHLPWQYRDGYAKYRFSINGKEQTYALHRQIMGEPDYQVDHIDTNPLNNQKNNLRLATSGQNKFNNNGRKKRKCKYKGVSKSPPGCTKPFRATIQFEYKSIYLGVFDSEEEAAIAYNQKSKELFGEFARLNIIQGEIPEFNYVKKEKNNNLPKGITLTRYGKFMARVQIDGKTKSLGNFHTEEEAANAIKNFRN